MKKSIFLKVRNFPSHDAGGYQMSCCMTGSPPRLSMDSRWPSRSEPTLSALRFLHRRRFPAVSVLRRVYAWSERRARCAPRLRTSGFRPRQSARRWSARRVSGVQCATGCLKVAARRSLPPAVGVDVLTADIKAAGCASVSLLGSRRARMRRWRRLVVPEARAAPRIARHRATRHRAAQHHAMRRRTAQHRTAQHYTARHRTA